MLIHITVLYLVGELAGRYQEYAFYFRTTPGAAEAARESLASTMRVLGREYEIVAESKHELDEVVKGGMYWASNTFAV